MERLSDTAIEIINELHTERLDYSSEYIPLIDAANRLAAYEDTGLEPEDVRRLQKDWTSLIITIDEMGCMPHLRELYEAEKEGRLVLLPCKVGDKVYQIDAERVYESEVKGIIYDAGHIDFDERAIGKTVFLTREEAEAALAQEGGKDHA